SSDVCSSDLAIPPLPQTACDGRMLEELRQVGRPIARPFVERLPVVLQRPSDGDEYRFPTVALPDRLHEELQARVPPPEEDVLLALEVAEERARRHVGLAGDLRDRPAFQASLPVPAH